MAFKGRGRSVNRGELAEVFGVSLPTITAWVRKGCPFIKRGGRAKPWEFNTSDVSEWLRDEARAESEPDEALDENQLKLRKMAADAAHAELDLAVARRKVAPIDEFERARAMENAVIRANVMNVPSRVVSQLIGETSEARFKEVLSGELVQALETAADADVELDDEEGDDSGDG